MFAVTVNAADSAVTVEVAQDVWANYGVENNVRVQVGSTVVWLTPAEADALASAMRQAVTVADQANAESLRLMVG